MRTQTTNRKNSDVEVLGIDYFYEKFRREKRRYDPSLFCVGTKTKKKRKQEVPLSLFKKIILEYLKMYFWDVYMSPDNRSVYFPLGGFLKKVLYPKWVRRQQRSTSDRMDSGSPTGAIGLMWYLRPSPKMHYMVWLKKQAGSTNRITALEKIYCDNFNKDLLPIFKLELRKAIKSKTLHLCIPT